MRTKATHTPSASVQTKLPLSMKAALISFCRPISWLWPIVLGVILFIEVTRVPWGLGFEYNMVILTITLALFYYGASRLRHVMTVGVRPAVHAVGGVVFGGIWSIGIAIANTISATAAYARDYYHYTTDSFFVQVDGWRQLIDTNGQPYVVPDGGLTVPNLVSTSPFILPVWSALLLLALCWAP